ncbi:MAG: zinc metallopeptidase [Defluviitaleaceae bacterium]|nr:zinc metallopeptidase [Defluviitaleaceae bacterium]
MFPFLMFDATFFVLIPAVILALFAQARVSMNMGRFSQVVSRRGFTGAQVAQAMLERAGISDVPIEMLEGGGDHYDPKSRTIRLSAHNFQTASITAVAVAAHEAGHAIQHNQGYMPLAFRTGIFPLVRITSFLAWPLFFIGIFMAGAGEFTEVFIDLGIIFFAVTVFFHMVTLPVEFNASSRAMEMLADGRYLEDDELPSAKKVLGAAAMTYVAATAMALLQLLRMILLRGRRN